MTNIFTSLASARRVAAVAIVAVAFPLAASSASAAPTGASGKGKRATWTKSSTPSAAASTSAPAPAPAVTSTPAVTSVHSIGGYVFYNVTYLEAVDLWFAAVAAAPAGYTPPPVYSVSATTTVSGPVTGDGR